MLSALIVGLVVGIIAKLLMPGPDGGGIIVTTLLGVAGAMTAQWIGQALGFYLPGEPASFLGAVLGAMLLLAVFRSFSRRR